MTANKPAVLALVFAAAWQADFAGETFPASSVFPDVPIPNASTRSTSRASRTNDIAIRGRAGLDGNAGVLIQAANIGKGKPKSIPASPAKTGESCREMQTQLAGIDPQTACAGTPDNARQACQQKIAQSLAQAKALCPTPANGAAAPTRPRPGEAH